MSVLREYRGGKRGIAKWVKRGNCERTAVRGKTETLIGMHKWKGRKKKTLKKRGGGSFRVKSSPWKKNNFTWPQKGNQGLCRPSLQKHIKSGQKRKRISLNIMKKKRRPL